MANFKQDSAQTGGFTHTGPQQCAQCEAMLTDVLDGTLAEEEQGRFDRHVATCTACQQMLADAQRGAAWLELLRSPRPEPPAALLERILAQTSGPVTGQAAVLGGVAEGLSLVTPTGATMDLDGWDAGETSRRRANVLPFRSRMTAAFARNSVAQTLLQPRLAMTAAMAFFSIGLTLNLTGVRLNELRAADLKPANLRRSFYQADAHLVRYYTNLRVVYELESRVRDLQHANEDEAPPPVEQEKKPADVPKSKTAHPTGPGTSRRQSQRERDTWNVALLDAVGLRLSSKTPDCINSLTRDAQQQGGRA